MATKEKLKVMSTNIRSDMEDFLEFYLIEDIWQEDDLISYINKLENLKREHRHIHTQIKEV